MPDAAGHWLHVVTWCVECAADGTTPLCAAALWGDAAMVKLLLSHRADPSATNTGAVEGCLNFCIAQSMLTAKRVCGFPSHSLSGTLWTPLHAAAFQEHGKVRYMMLCVLCSSLPVAAMVCVCVTPGCIDTVMSDAAHARAGCAHTAVGKGKPLGQRPQRPHTGGLCHHFSRHLAVLPRCDHHPVVVVPLATPMPPPCCFVIAGWGVQQRLWHLTHCS